MINVTCFKCGWKFTIDEEAIAESFAEAKTPSPRHYVAECPRCRKANKVSLKRSRRRGRRAKKEYEIRPSDPPNPDHPTKA